MAIENMAENLLQFREVIARYKQEKGALMPVLQAAQELFGCVPREAQETIAEELGIPLSEVYGVSTFYSQFTLEPNGEHVINVCMGTACYVKGAQRILDKLSEALDVPPNKTTKDAKFTLNATRCIGACGLAPVILIGEEAYGNLSPDDLPGILQRYRD